MSFLKNLFGNGDKEESWHTDFQEGDIFYWEKDKAYYVYKLLIIDDKTDTFHVTSFHPTSTIPKPEDIKSLKKRALHSPIASDGMGKVKFVTNEVVTDDDLLGYFTYIQQVQDMDEIVKYAKRFYQEAHALSRQNDQVGAIEKYTKAIELIPGFYEAIDNRAFCFMSLGQWEKAIEGFNHSLQVKPDTLLAVFSIGECYLRLKDYPKAKIYFEKAVQIDPNHPKPKEFLAVVNKVIG